ncbi:MAG: pSer/pThr/pTyr-binding forkhead associated (FHA) protein, partial [Myxococcota bacterium]
MATLEDTQTRQQHLLFASTLIGRSRTCNLAVDDREVSGQHILLRWTGSEWEARDLGSRNGTWVDG